jgi:hypothetical protein
MQITQVVAALPARPAGEVPPTQGLDADPDSGGCGLTSLGQVAKESTKSLGPSAYLVNVVPSLVLVLTAFTLVSSRLYPWMSQLHNAKGKPVAQGLPSVTQTVQDLNVAGGVLLLLAVLLLAIMLRPFQVVAVQFLEGYWRRRGLLEGLAVELHARRLTTSLAREQVTPESSGSEDFETVAMDSQRARRIAQMRSRAGRVAGSYPAAVADLLPTSLGNVLRRAETSAGERYGLGTVITYPRLYPHISARLDAEMTIQLDLIDTMAAFTLVFGCEAFATAPLVVRVDGWSLLPVAFVFFSLIAYRGARRAAQSYAVRLATSYDLHRFDMLQAMHRPLPNNASQEYSDNSKLTAFLGGILPIVDSERAGWRYVHPGSTAQERELDSSGGQGGSGSSDK